VQKFFSGSEVLFGSQRIFVQVRRKTMSSNQLSRRDFLKATGLAGVGVAITACAPVAAPAEGEAGVPSAEKMTVTVWGWWEERMKIFQACGDDYKEKMPNVDVVVETIAEGIWEKVFASVPAGTGPTLCKMQTTNYFKLRDQGLLIELGDTIFPSISLRTKYPDHGWGQYGFYCAPEGVQPAIFTYNKKLFGEAGLDPETPPKTWGEFFAAGEKLTQRDASGAITLAGFQYNDWLPILNPLYQLGGNIVKREGDALAANLVSSEAEQAFQFFLDAAQKYKIWDPNFPYVSDAIGNGQAAMSIGEAWVRGTYKNDFPETFKDLGFGAPPTPTGEAQPYYGRKNAVLSLALIKNRPQPESDAGLKFLEYLVVERLDTQFDLANISGLVPAHAELVTSEKVTGDAFLSLGSQLAPKEYDTVEVSDTLNTIIADTLNRVLLENQPLASSLEQGQEALQRAIDEEEMKYVY
jgi:multiple sugar transport system substrate-binding protein